MIWTTNTCYRITYDDYSSVTFRIEGEIPPAFHLIRIRDINSGTERFLYDLLIPNWIDCRQIGCIS